VKTKLASLFWNAAEDRLRAGWRIVLTWMALVILVLPVQFAIKPLFPASWTKNQKIGGMVGKPVQRQAVNPLPVKTGGYTTRSTPAAAGALT
jgi:hypothetical protein